MFTASLTDQRGVTHTEAIFRINTASCDENSNSNLVLDLAELTTNQNDNSHYNLNYSVYYWETQASYDNNDMPHLLCEHLNTNHHCNDKHEGMSLEECAEMHCKNVLLPRINAANAGV